jgi:TonB family protein
VKPETRNLKLLFILASCLFFAANLSWPQDSDEEIETLGVIEIPGTAVILEERQLIFPKPDINDFSPPPASEAQRISADFHLNHNFHSTSVPLDPIGKQRGIKSNPIPVKMDRPPYPRIEKEPGWQGTVKLTLTIGPEGKISSATVPTSSGFPILDQIALEATDDWLFQPQKDGEFAVLTNVNIPVKFNLHEKK